MARAGKKYHADSKQQRLDGFESMDQNRALMHRIRNALRYLWQQDVCRSRPSALINYRYFLPGQAPAIRWRRRLWLNSRYRLPLLFWLPLEMLRWWRWLFWQAPQLCAMALAEHGEAVAARTGISVSEQQKALRYWMQHWCLSPGEVYVWQLYHPETDGLAMIYATETQAFHRLQNQHPHAKAELRLLNDKIGLARCLESLGLVMVPVVTPMPISWPGLRDATRCGVL
jgi:hypothetical protein